MKYTFKIHSVPYAKIKNGEKIIESRLFDEKRKLLKVGDTIEFMNLHSGESIVVIITNLEKRKSFSELVDMNSPKDFGWAAKKEVLAELGKFYSPEDEKKFSVLGIKFKKL